MQDCPSFSFWSIYICSSEFLSWDTRDALCLWRRSSYELGIPTLAILGPRELVRRDPSRRVAVPNSARLSPDDIYSLNRIISSRPRGPQTYTPSRGPQTQSHRHMQRLTSHAAHWCATGRVVRTPATNNDLIVDRRAAAKIVEVFTPCHACQHPAANDRRSNPNATYAV